MKFINDCEIIEEEKNIFKEINVSINENEIIEKPQENAKSITYY